MVGPRCFRRGRFSRHTGQCGDVSDKASLAIIGTAGHAGSIIRRSAEDTITTVEQAVNDWVV